MSFPIRVLDAHERHAQAVAFTPDSAMLVSVGMDAAIRTWRVPGFEPAGVILGHQNSVNSVVLSRDGRRLGTCSTDGTARIWSFPEGQLLHVLEGQRLPRWSPDGRLLTTISARSRITHWDATTCELLQELPAIDRRVICFEHAPDEGQLLIGGTGTIHRVRLHNGAPIATLTGHGVAVMSLAVSPNRAVLASTGAEGTLRFWDTAGWQVLREIPLHTGGALATVWAPDGSQVAVAGDHVVQLVALRERDPIIRLEVAIKGLYGVAFSPDGRWLANAGADGRLRIWEMTGSPA